MSECLLKTLTDFTPSNAICRTGHDCVFNTPCHVDVYDIILDDNKLTQPSRPLQSQEPKQLQGMVSPSGLTSQQRPECQGMLRPFVRGSGGISQAALCDCVALLLNAALAGCQCLQSSRGSRRPPQPPPPPPPHPR